MTVDHTDKQADIEEIKRLKALYFRSMDTKDWSTFRSLFTEDVIVDVSQAFHPADYEGRPIERGLPRSEPDPKMVIHGLDAFMVEQHRHLTGVSTVHHGHMPEIDILSPEEASGIWAMEDKLRWPAGSSIRTMHGYGHYHERYRKVNGRWRIASLRLTRIRVDREPG
jgi:hypothetical protein